jgi:hypothetical protein
MTPANLTLDVPSLESICTWEYLDANGNKVCSAAIDASQAGMLTGEFAESVNLSPGDYYLAWASEAKVEVQTFNTGADQLALMNAGATVVAGVGRCDGGNALPDKLGALTPRTSSAPILAYFKA